MFILWILYCFFAVVTVIMCAPIPLEIVDLSYTFDETTPYWPTQKKFELVVTVNETQEEGY
ncbi:hypothetical protein AVEN_130444-1, partial [Araneus ventricosus]